MSIIEPIYQAMHRDQSRVNQIAGNIANTNTPGFKARLIGEGNDTSASEIDMYRSSKHGRILSTGKTTDLALQGSGYFVTVSGDNIQLTRNGSFLLDANNYLVTSVNGAKVQGENGDILLTNADFVVSPEGEITVDGSVQDKLQIVNSVDDNSAINNSKDANNNLPPSSSLYTVHQGYLEASNVDSTQEMIALMETQRHYITMQKFYIAIDGLLRNAISSLGK